VRAGRCGRDFLSADQRKNRKSHSSHLNGRKPNPAESTDSSIPFFRDLWMLRLWQCGQCIATKTPLIGRAQRSRAAGRRERFAGKNNRSDDESRAASWRGMPRKTDRYLRALAIFPRRGYIRASAAATPKTRPRNLARPAALRSLPAFRRSPVGPRRPAIGSTASRREGTGRISLRIRHKTGFRLRIFQP
jgi:hypothetical protein